MANSTAQAVVELALRYVGYPYTWAGASPETGFDCSGFTSYIYKQFGYTLNRTAAGQINDGIGVARDQLLPGDIIIMSVHGDITRVGHVAMLYRRWEDGPRPEQRYWRMRYAGFQL